MLTVKANGNAVNTVEKILIKPASIIPFLTALFEAAGLTRDHAARVSENLYESEVRGVYSHGLSLAVGYVKGIAAGIINRDPHIQVLRETPSLLLVDGDFAAGAVAGGFAMRRAIEKARENGFAAASVKRGAHFGMAAFYSMMALEHDMIGVASCNSDLHMSVYGGSSRVLGTNPISVAVPAKNHLPVVFDGATSQVAFGKLAVASLEGESIPADWALDENGEPTTDPKAGMIGGVVPFGGYKGSGLAVIVNLLTTVLSGAEIFADNAPGVQSGGGGGEGVGFFFAALDIGQLQDLDFFKRRVDEMIDGLKASRKRPGFDEIYMPGELEYLRKQKHLESGIPVRRGVYDALRETARELGAAFSLETA
jgi:LDH2 family malate/lactate/ureidoglycolate dehydrogenase